MTDDKERSNILLALQALLEEFHSAPCSNERKRIIEEQLTSFSRQSNALDLCLSFLPLTRDPYVLMFVVNLIEGAVQRSWPRLMSDEKILIRRSVASALLTAPSEMVAFIRIKLCKVLVDIGRFDWPHFYPDYFNNIFQLINNHSTRLVGVLLLRTTSEEFISPKDDLCASRKKELKHLLNNLVPQMLTSLTGVLDEILMSCQASSCTPPPSPTHPSSAGQSSMAPLTSSAPIAQAYIGAASGTHLSVESHLHKPGNNQQLNPHKPLDASSRELALACLSALEQLTSWVSIGSNFGPSMLNTLFGFIWLGCGERADVNGAAAVAAVSVINELVYKKCFTQRDTQACLVSIFENTFRVLQLVTQNSGVQRARLHEVDPLLVTKLGELLHILIENHLSRFPDETPDAPLVQFVHLVQAFTLGLNNGEQYLVSLDTWLCFFENIEASGKTLKYKQLLGHLLDEVMSRVMTKNHPQIQEMSTDGDESEWENHLRKSLQVVSKISELVVEETCVHIISVWDSAVASFENGHSCTNEQLKDLSTLARTIGCLASPLSLLVENCINAAQIPVKLVGDLLRVVRRSSDILRQGVNSVSGPKTSDCVCSIEKECLASIQSYLHLLGASMTENAHNGGSVARQIVNQIAETALEVCVQRRGASAAASAVLVSMTTRFRFPYLMEGLYPKLVPIMCGFSCEDDIVLLKNCAISLQNICLLPWIEVSLTDQKFDTRKAHYEAVVQNLLNNAHQSNNNAYPTMNGAISPNQNHLQSHVERMKSRQAAMVFEIATAMVESLSSNCTSKSKSVVAECFEKLLEASEGLLLREGRQIEPQTGETVMAFYKACFQFIPSKLDRFIDRLLEMTGFAGNLVTDASLVPYLEGLLGLLREILLSPSKGSVYLRRILQLALELWPRTMSGEGEVLRPTLIQLFHHILLFHWRHFFPTNVAHLISATGSPAVDSEVANKSELVAIMQAYGWCLVQQTRDIEAFGEVLRSLQELNNKCKLYKRPIFESLMMVEFLGVLMRALLAKSHELFRDEILQIVFAMALAIGPERFQEGYLPQFVSQIENLSNHQREQLVRDFRVHNELISFSESLNSFFTDIRYFLTCNQALPPFSVAL